MKITCNIIEDLLPLYVDDMVSEDSRKLVEEHLKECPACRKMQEEMMRENCLSAGRKDGNSAQINKTEAEPLKKIRRRIRKKRIFSVILAVALVAAAGGVGHYWYYGQGKLYLLGCSKYISKRRQGVLCSQSAGKAEIDFVRGPEKHVLYDV